MRTTALASSVFLFAGLVACTSTPSTPVTQPGSGVYTPEVQAVVLQDLGGGLIAPPPPGKCNTSEATFTVNILPRDLDWSMCNGTTTVTGSRTLSADEWATVEAKLDALVVVTGTTCGADKAQLALTVKIGDFVQLYGDSFYACMIHDRPLIDTSALDAIDSTLRGLASK